MARGWLGGGSEVARRWLGGGSEVVRRWLGGGSVLGLGSVTCRDYERLQYVPICSNKRPKT